MGFVKEFKDFAFKGNIVDLAVAVILGGAFGKIVDSVVADLIMPIIGMLAGGTDFKSLSFGIGDAKITYGNFISAVINFMVIAFVLFLIIKAANKMKKEAPAAPAEPSSTDKLLAEIRDALKK
jgi:large conductance mechanosensitive channel